MLQFDEEALGPKIKVIGVGGGGGNAVNTMIEADVQGVEFVAANTDCQVLETNLAPVKVQLGKGLTKGLGAGANPEIGAAAALEDAARLAEVLGGADMVFVTAGMGGGTGTGAAPVVAQIARDLGALTVGVVTRPFAFEGMQRKKKAGSGLAQLAKAVDALIVIPNDRLLALAGKDMTLRDAFAQVDQVCLNAVRGISDIITMPGLINVDFADVRAVMTGMGRTLMGTGRGRGERRAFEATQAAINSPLLEDVSINGATGILVNITGGADLKLSEIEQACGLVHEAADTDANIIFGSVIDPTLGEEVRVTVIATGFQATATDSLGATAKSAGGRAPAQMPLLAEPARAVERAPSAAAVPVAVPAPPSPGRAMAAFEADEATTPTPIAVAPYPPAPVTPAPVTIHPAVQPSPGLVASGPGEAWPANAAAQARPSRPLVAAAASPGAPGRRTPSFQPALAEQDLGIEESELDRPTYARRGVSSGSIAIPRVLGRE